MGGPLEIRAGIFGSRHLERVVQTRQDLGEGFMGVDFVIHAAAPDQGANLWGIDPSFRTFSYFQKAFGIFIAANHKLV